MRCQSISSSNTDGYRAGSELGEALRALAPEVVLLFASITYQEQFADVFDGLADGLGAPPPIVFGGTSDGIYETSRVAHHGICALGLHSDGAVRWSTALEPGVAADSAGTARTCAQRVAGELEGQVDFAIAFADGVKADGSAIVAGLAGVLPIPFIGGLTADDRKFVRSFVFLNGRAYEDAIAILGARGPVSFRVNSASGWQPVGEAGTVEECAGSTLERISGMSPQSFMREQMGKTPGETDLAIVPLATYDAAGHHFLRTASHFDLATGAATMFGSVQKGATVRVCTARRDDVLNAVDHTMRAAQADGFVPAGALVVSCAGRKWLLEDRAPEEVEHVFSALGRRIPLVGLPSFGEIGPFRREDGSYTPAFFHNVTFVICLFGA